MAKKLPPAKDFSLQSTRVGFNIPKIKKVESTALLKNVPLSDRNSAELIKEVDRTCIDRELKFKKQWKVNVVHLISPPSAVETRYREKRAELKDHGGVRLLQEVLGFFVCKDKSLAIKIAREGIRVNRHQSGCLGDPSQGVYFFRYLDVALLSQRDSKNVYVMVFKVLLGRTKQVPVSDSGSATGAVKEPTPNYDVHVSQFAPNPSESFHNVISKSQMYVYEYTDDAVPTKCPRQCLPYALIEFSSCGSGRKDDGAHATSPKNISSSAASAGWTSARRPASESIRKVAFETPRPFTKEPPSFAHPPVQHIPPITPPLTPNDAESLCSPQGREALFSPGNGGSHVNDQECSAWRALEERADNYQHVPMDLSNTPDRPPPQQATVVPSHPRSLDFKETRFWLMSSESSCEPSSDNAAHAAAASRDAKMRQFLGEPSVRQLEVELEENLGIGHREQQSSSSAPAQNVLATVNRLWGRANSTPAEHAASHRQVEQDPMDSWGLTWNGNDDEGEENQNMCSSQAQGFHHERPCVRQSADHRCTKVQSSEQEKAFAKSLFERSCSEPSSALLSERDLAFLCGSGDSPSVKKIPPVPLLNRTPIKSALKKTVPVPLTPSAEGKKKKMSFQDYLKKKRAEAVTETTEMSEMNLPLTVANNVRTETVTASSSEPTDDATCPSTKSVCTSRSPNIVCGAESGSSIRSSNSSCSSSWASLSNRKEAAEVQTTTGYGQTSMANSVSSPRPAPACSSVPRFAIHQFAVNFQKALGRDPRLHSKLRTLNTSSHQSSRGDGVRPDARVATTPNGDIAAKNQVNHKIGSDQLTGMCQETQAELGNVTQAKLVLQSTDGSSLEEGKALDSGLTENRLTLCGENNLAQQDSVEVNVVSKPTEAANHQVLFSDIPDDFDNENALCMSLDEYSQENLSKVGEIESSVASNSGEVKNTDGAKETKSEGAEADMQQQETPVMKASSLSGAEPNKDSSDTSAASGSTKKQDAFATESLLCVPTVEQSTFSSEYDEDAAHLLRIAKGLRGKPAQSAAEDARKSRNVSPCSDTSSRKSRNVSPCSDSSARTSSLSYARSSKESTPDLLKSGLLQFSSAASTETDDSDKTSTSGQRGPAESKIGSLKRRKPKAKLRQEGSSIDVNALEPNIDPYALLRLSKGLRPGKSIHVGGLGKNPTDDPLPVLGDDRRKRKNQTNVKNGGKQTATKKERRLQQGQITEQKVIKRRRNAGNFGKKKSKKKSTVQANPSPPVDDDIDYTNFQFDEPQEFCVSICDDMESAGEGSAAPVSDSVTVKVEAAGASRCEGSQALPLSYLGLSHWTEALVQPRLDPQVTLVDFFKAYSGYEDFENCAICRKVIDLSLVESDDQIEDDVQSSTTKETSELETWDPASEQSKNCFSSASASLAEAAAVKSRKEFRQSKTSSEGPSSEKSLDKTLSSPKPLLAETKEKETETEDKNEPSESASAQRIMAVSPVRLSSAEPATVETVKPGPSVTASTLKRNPPSEENVDTSLSSSSEPAAAEIQENSTEGLLSETAVTKTKTENRTAGGGLPVSEKKNRDPSLERSLVQTFSSSSGPAATKSVREKTSENMHLETGTAAVQNRDFVSGQMEDKSFSASISKTAAVEEKNMQSAETSSREAATEVKSRILSSVIREEGNEVTKECSELCIQKDLHKPDTTSTTSASTLSTYSPAELKSSDAATSEKAPALGLPKRSRSADETTDLSEQKCPQSSLHTGNVSNYSTSHKGSAPGAAPTVRGSSLKPSFTVCSQGSTKQCWQRWKAQRMQGKAMSDTEGSPQQQNSVSSVGYAKPDLNENEMSNYERRPGNLSCASKSGTEVLTSTTSDGGSWTETVSDLHNTAQDLSSSSSGQGTVQGKSWLESGFWLGIDELKTLHKPAEDTEVCEDTQEIYSRSAIKISPTKLSQLITVKGALAEVEDAYSACSQERAEVSGPVRPKIDALCRVKEAEGPMSHAVENTTQVLHPPAQSQIDALSRVGEGDEPRSHAVENAAQVLHTRAQPQIDALSRVEEGDRPKSHAVEKTAQVLHTPAHPPIDALSRVREGHGSELHAAENTVQVHHTDNREFFEMVMGETSVSEASSKSIIPGLDLVDHSKQQKTVDTSTAETNVKSWNPNRDLPNVLEIAKKVEKEFLEDQCLVEDKSSEVNSKSADSAEIHLKEILQEAKRQTQDIVYRCEDLDILGTPNLDSNRIDTRKKRLTFVCKSRESKTRSSNEAIAKADYCDDKSEKKDGHSQQDDSLKTDRSETVKIDFIQTLKEGGVTGCPIPSFTSTRNNQKNKDKKAKNKLDGSEPPNSHRADSSNTAENERSECTDITLSQGAGPVFHTSNFGQPAAPGTDTLGPENMSVRPFGHNVPHSQVSHGFTVGQPLYQQPLLVGPMLIPNASVPPPNAPMHMMNALPRMVNTSMPMAVPMPMLSTVPVGVPPPDQHFMVYSRQSVPFPRPMVQPLFTGPPTPLPAAMSMQPPPAGTVMQKEASSPIEPDPQPCPVTVVCHQNGGQEIPQGNSSVHNTGPTISGASLKSSSRFFTETADDSRNDARCVGDFSVSGRLTDREAPPKHPPKRHMYDWFSDILDGKRNAPTGSEQGPESKKARLDFMESWSHKQTRAWDSEEKSRQSTSSVRRRNSLCDSEDKSKRESASSRKRASPCNSENKTSAKKHKENIEVNRISFRVGFSSDAVTKRCGPLRKSVKLDSDSDSDSDGSAKRTERGTHRHEKSKRETSKGKTPVTETTCKDTDSVKDSKVITEKGKPVTKSSRISSEKKKVTKSRHGFESDNDESKKTFPRRNKRDTDSENLQSQLGDIDDEMKGYAHALLDTDATVASLEMISNQISLCIAESLCSPCVPSASDSAVGSKNWSRATEDGSTDQTDSNCEETKTSLTDKPLEFLYFAKEMIMKKLKEEGSGPANSPTYPDQSDPTCSTESASSAGPSLACVSQQPTKTIHVDQGQTMACVEAGGQVQTTDNATELTQNEEVKSSALSVTLTASKLSAITEEEMAKLKDIVMSCLPVTTSKTGLVDAGTKSSCSEKGKTVLQTDDAARKKNSTSDEKNKIQAVERRRKPSSAGRDWSRFLTSSRPAFRSFSSGGIERKNYYGDVLDAPVPIDKIKPQPEGFRAASATPVSRPNLHVIRTDFNTERKPKSKTDTESASCVNQTNVGSAQDSQHGLSNQFHRTSTITSSTAGSSPQSVSAAQRPLVQANCAASAKPATVADLDIAQTFPTHTNSAAAQKPAIKADSATPQRPPTPTNSTYLTKPSFQCGSSTSEKFVDPSVGETATTLRPSIEAVSSVAAKDSVPSTQTEPLPITAFRQIEVIPRATTEVSDDTQHISTVASKKGHVEKPRPSTSADSVSTPSIQPGATTQPQGKENNTRQGEESVNTLHDFLLAQFPDIDPYELAPLLSFRLTCDVAKIGSKTKKSIVQRVRKHLENQSTTAPPSVARAVSPAPSLSQLEEFAVGQIEIELSLVEGTLKLLEATRAVQSIPDEMQIGPNGQPIVKHSSPSNADIVKDALMTVVQDFNKAMQDAHRGWKCRPHQRLPSEVLLCDEQEKLYTREGSFVVLISSIPNKPFARLVQMRVDIEACLNKIGHAACHNKTEVVLQERRRIQQLQLQRLQLMRSFTGTVSPNRLKKIRIHRDHYATCRDHLLRVLGSENVTKMVFFKASAETVQGHLQILEREMGR